MAGTIPQSFIEELRERIDLVDVVGERVRLKRVGANYVGLCPFHRERSPSFNVNPERQFYHCFGCGAGGDAFRFVMELDRLSFVEAVELLAAHAGLSVPKVAGTAKAEQTLEPVYRLLAEVAIDYARCLREHPQARQAVEYLKGRGLGAEAVRGFGLGYAPPGWQHLCERFPLQALQQAGLAVEKAPGEGYDRFRERIMFPIRDRRGRVVGFGGRVLRPDQEPKYLNSPETPVFHKRCEVYGLYELLQAERKPSRIVVVEGYMDVIALFQQGLPCAVATLGTAVSGEQIDLLYRHTTELVFCFDGDAAGMRAAWRAVEALLPRLDAGREARFLSLPAGHDPDSLVRAEGQEGFRRRLEEAVPFSEYFFARLAEDLRMDTLEGRARLDKQSRPLLAQLPEGAYKALMLQRLRELVGLYRPRALAFGRNPPGQEGRGPRPPSSLDQALRLLLQQPALARRVDDGLLERVAALSRRGALLTELVRACRDRPAADAKELIESFAEHPGQDFLRRLWAGERLLAEPEAATAEFDAAMRRLALHCDHHRWAALLAKARDGPLSAEEREELRALQRNRVVSGDPAPHM